MESFLMQVNLQFGLRLSIFRKIVRLFVPAIFLLCPVTLSAADHPQVTIKTNLGDIVLELDATAAPVTVQNFLSYVDDGSYKDTIFHRVIAGFMIQGGGHAMDMSAVPDSGTILNEADNGLKNVRGSIAMARMNEIDSASRQFFINVADNNFLDHNAKSCTREDEKAIAEARQKGMFKPATCKSFGYAVFGKVVKGMDVVDLIELTETRSVGMYDDVPVTPVVVVAVERLK